MKLAVLLVLSSLATANVMAGSAVKILSKVDPLPVALNDDFQFRKTKLFYLNENPPKSKKSLSSSLSTNPNNPTAGIAEASIGFERTYRMYGAISNAERNQRFRTPTQRGGGMKLVTVRKFE